MELSNLKHIVTQALKKGKYITVLTGAGISAESGIPTFRGPEGYWTIGSKEYQPQEMATYWMFKRKPYEVWKWYLYRIKVCSNAKPNSGHIAIAKMEKLLKDNFRLITQNVDGLHLKAGNSIERTFQIHGNIFFVRCSQECSKQIYPLPEGIKGKNKGEDLTEEEKELLKCPRCGAILRPHVLWFDEYYNEEYFYYESSLKVASETELLITVGTSGATNLPNQIVWTVYSKGGTIIDINIQENPFSEIAEKSKNGFFIKESSSKALPKLLESIAQLNCVA
jgi:NAD-dependent deacetylase